MPHLVLTVDGSPVAESDIPAHEAEAYAAAFPKAYVPQEYPKWVERDGERTLVHSAEEEHGAEPDAEPAEAVEHPEAE